MLVLDRLGKIYPNSVNALERRLLRWRPPADLRMQSGT